MIELILASTSPARRALMDALGVPYRAVAPDVGEDCAPGTSPSNAVLLLAERKAQAVAARFRRSLVIGADQMVSLDGISLGKPKDRDSARAQLEQLSGRAHELATGLCVIGPDFFERHLDRVKLTTYPLSSGELERYLDTNEWHGCAGGYRIEGRGQALFSAIEGDRTTVQGLPMLLVVGALRRAGAIGKSRSDRS